MTGRRGHGHVSGGARAWPDDARIEVALQGLRGSRNSHWQGRNEDQPDIPRRDRRSPMDREHNRPAQSQRDIRRNSQPNQTIFDRFLTWACRLGWIDVALTVGIIGGGVIWHLAQS